MKIKIRRGFSSAMVASAVAHVVLVTIIVFAWSRDEARSPSTTARTASFTRAATPAANGKAEALPRELSEARGTASAFARATAKEASPRSLGEAYVWTEAYDARVTQAPGRPGAGARVWLIPAVFETTRRSIEDDIFNHLWQSTLFALAIGLLVLPFKQKEARTRYWLWCAASVKFLLPIAALERLGGLFPLAAASPAASMRTAMAITHMAEPFTRATVSTIGTVTVGSLLDWLPPALWFVWFVGAEFVILRRAKAWRHVRAAARDSQPAALNGIVLPNGIQIRMSKTLLEPGTVGLWKPALLVPAGIDTSLTAAELKTVIDHEACHIRCRDNLTAALQMLIEAIFWFHPLVWWIGARMVDERERACDEHVLASLENPRTYADAILHVCQRYVYAGLAAVPGVGGGDLRRRIERIMHQEVGDAVSPRVRAWLAAGAAMVIVGPVGIGAVTTPPTPAAHAATQAPQTRTTAAKPAFQTTSIKPNASGNLRVQFFPDAPGWFTAINAPAWLLIRFAYNLPDFAITGTPNWVNSDRFDITATVPGNDSIDVRRLMLQRLFEERFMLKAHIESRPLPIYAMRLVNRNGALGPHLHRTTIDCTNAAMLPLEPGRIQPPPRTPQDMSCGFFGMSPATSLSSGTGGLAFRGLTMGALAKALTNAVHRTVIDQTGLTGYFDGEFDFIAELPPPPPPPGLPNPFTAPFSSVFSVLPDQLGVKLDGDRGPVDVLVIDSIQHPTSD